MEYWLKLISNGGFMSKTMLSKHVVVKTNDWHTAYKCARVFGGATGLPVRIKRLPTGKRIVVTDRILWENDGCPQYRLYMPKTKRILSREIFWY